MQLFMKSAVIFSVFMLAACFAGTVRASQEPPDAEAAAYWRDKPVPENAEVTYGTEANGKRYRLLTMPGVTVTQYEGGGSLAVDTDGNGGVMCVWEILSIVKTYLDACKKYSPPYLDEAMKRVEDFIVENSDTVISEKITKTMLEKKLLQKKMDALEQENFCETSGAEVLARGMVQTPEDKMRGEIDKLLFVPRIPVMNPCL